MSDEDWRRFCDSWLASRELGFTLDISRAAVPRELLDESHPPLRRALAAMRAMEAGALANGDEGRMVGHYWLRAPDLAPDPRYAEAISDTIDAIHAFVGAVREGVIRGAGGPFEHVIHVGIGGSALGPQLLCGALAGPRDPISVHFLDNADSDGIDALLAGLGGALDRTLVSVVSKCGWTPTPKHVTIEMEAAYRRAGLDFARHAVATTVHGTVLDRRAESEGWLGRFPLWEWVGGRTSVTSAVGLLPAALQGIDVRAFLAGAATMDRLTRSERARQNPAALLASAWHWLRAGRGIGNMVVLPYRDRLSLLPRYVQQLVMESIGKKLSREGELVRHGLTVYGNKGSTDQHSYIQQLRDGPADFFVTFVRAHEERTRRAVEVEPGLTLDDYLFGYLEGTRDALYERGRASVTLSIPRVDASSLGALVALFERTVGIYAELADLNAYHQPGVDKDAAAAVVALQREVTSYLSTASAPSTAEEIARAIGSPERRETVFTLLDRLSRSPAWQIEVSGDPSPELARFALRSG